MKVKIRSKYILLLFVSMIVVLFGGIYFAAQQEKEDPIKAAASGPVYWQEGGVSSLSTTTCLLCGKSVDASNGTLVAWSETPGDGCVIEYYHWGPRGSRYCYSTITVHNAITHRVDPTCYDDGYTYMECAQCGEQTTKTTLPALGHEYKVWEYNDDATCTEDGTESALCSRCRTFGSLITRTVEGTKLGHDWVEEWTTDGTSHWHKCSRCDEINDKANHNGGTATCTNPAKCEVCGAEYGEALGHDIEYHAGKEPTCTAIGWNAYETCSRCDYTTYQEIAATGHTPGAAATCTTPQTCTECGTTLAEATGHTWDSGTISKNPTCYSTGIKRYECTTCGEIKTETLSKVSHDYTLYRSRIEPTCTTSGRTAGYECRWCTATTCSTIPALGHSYGSYTQTKAPTCTEKGTETAKCIRCTSQKTRNIDALGHDLEYHAGKEPTCTSVGWNAYETCNRAGCGYTTYREIAATGHTPGAAATCTTSQTCTVCGATLVEALGHKTVSHLGQDPTCTQGGWKPYETCENCDYTTYVEIEALGHSFTSYVSDNNATCTEDGTETAKCDRCEVTDTRTNKGSALGHDWAEEWTTDGTAHWHECSRCDEINDKANHIGGIATCIALAKCEICGAEYGDFAEHVYVENADEQYLVSAATCTVKATYYKSCSVCGEAGEEIFEYGEPLGAVTSKL